MTFALELKKLRRTGFFPIFLGCAFFAALIPAVNTGARPETFTALPGSPGSILLDANWEIMTMLYVLFSVMGACVIYHTEYSGRALLKMASLPVSGISMFFAKCLLLELFGAASILTGCLSFLAVSLCWFPERTLPVKEILLQGGFSMVLMLPFVVLMLLIASWYSNMWTPLGVGVLLVFAETILRSGSFALRLLPFSLPFQTLSALSGSEIRICLGAAAGELLILGLAAWILQSPRVRRIAE